MANACPSIGLVLGVIATVGIIYTLASKEWKKNSQVASASVNYGIYSYEGLWVRCTSPVPGQFQCDNYDTSFINLPAELTAQRAMMCIAAILAVGALVAGTVGLECVKVMEGSSGKVWAGRSGGGMMMLAGILTLASVSWYAAGVIQDFYYQQATNSNFLYEFGAGLYVGWVTSGLAIISGILLACCTCGQNEDNEAPYNYTYKPPQKAANPNRTEYV